MKRTPFIALGIVFLAIGLATWSSGNSFMLAFPLLGAVFVIVGLAQRAGARNGDDRS